MRGSSILGGILCPMLPKIKRKKYIKLLSLPIHSVYFLVLVTFYFFPHCHVFYYTKNPKLYKMKFKKHSFSSTNQNLFYL